MKPFFRSVLPRSLSGWLFLGTLLTSAAAADIVTVRPKKLDDVLVNPGIGFTTFQRFNGDRLNEGLKWTEGFPIEYQEFKGSLANENHPLTSIAYFRVYWKFVEPEMGQYRWDMLDQALATAKARGQTLMLRVAPYGTGKENDAPDWYCALGTRYDGHPDLELVDVSIVGAWGEGAGAERLSDATRHALLDCYLETFRQTPLVLQLQDSKATQYALARQPVGSR